VVACPLDLLVGPSINTGIKYGKDFFKQTIGSSPNAFGLTCAEIDGLDLLNHHEGLSPPGRPQQPRGREIADPCWLRDRR